MNIGKTTICALASSVGKGGIGIVRVSGPLCKVIAKKMLGFIPKPRYAYYGLFFDQESIEIDKGIALFFPKPYSFTGEDVLEFQGHGGMIGMHSLLESAISMGAKLAEAGEFSKRSFLNGKMDLVQAEAISDMINANSKRASKSAFRSLSGEFSNQINTLTKSIIELRVFVEGTIDFSDEEIDFLQSNQVKCKIKDIKQTVETILKSATQSVILREGLNVAIAGKPNSGKSSLLNALTQESSAIVTDIEGTTRDVLKEIIHVNGVPLIIIDTAGLRDSHDKIEKEGIKRANFEIENADVVLMVFDAQDDKPDLSILPEGSMDKSLLLIKNKVDLTSGIIKREVINDIVQLSVSAKYSEGIKLLRKELFNISGLEDLSEGVVLARRRHIIALEASLVSIRNAIMQLEIGAIELMAEDLRFAGQFMGSITGEFSSDDLLDEIFSSFCIGK
ncbi:MAG: tRNA uridine-5-carboxymethylaminomethyl(34) synthesis GTPase MnmE [Candidatus Vesicomyosocius endoextente]|uniref:tRNA modification GTPase MnmE n=1 Tax=Candidatus Vesicomyosocius endoextente TaxID=2738853 RepID=A0A853GE09_9GAMM|nr:tRNA uridine-5-carboxymethylaminomethyl(34) synthesis GTPase MnmE [Candidatus Vesicomyosocius endoextente]